MSEKEKEQHADTKEEIPEAPTADDISKLVAPGVKKAELAKLNSSKWNIYAILAGILKTVSSILQSIMFPTFSKLSDLIGRIEAFVLALILYIISYIVQANSNNYGTFVGGQILNAFGDTGITILIPIITGDMTNIRNRGFYHGVLQLPTIINMFCTSLAVDSLLYTGEYPGQWRWGYGMVPLIIFFCSLPILVGLWYPQMKARKSGKLAEYREERRRIIGKRTFWQTLKFFGTELDFVGCILLVGGLCMILLPFQLESTWGGWTDSRTLGCLIGGFFTWIALFYWELKVATKPVLPVGKWPNKTALLGVAAVSANTIGSSTNGLYLRTYLQITRKVTAGRAARLVIGFPVAAITLQAFVGYMMMRTRIWRPYMWTGICILIIALGLMTQARQPHSSDVFLVVSQVIAGIGTGFMEVPFIVAVQSSVPHEDLAMITAFYQIGQSITSSVGSTIAGAIWNQLLPQEFEKHIPGEFNTKEILASITYAQSLPDDQYAGLQEAYGNVQRKQTIIHLCMAILTLFLTFPMKSFGLRNSKRFEEDPDDSKLDEVSTKIGSESEMDKKIADDSSPEHDIKPTYLQRFKKYVLS
ncbi:major facilitator superfamily domain-containing protein [Zychaea mexicana]|uniref:major facilitator superfamily domain-containing protein n=1 Tax=Zychaea mexicana TaxID=64656 RepID=UPI0022FE2EC3|nr:major facilitator superfamily domain-containing protein [Zychaea mexicana]KAI9474850.1 major facilitator superfamily domain-containing protein [Zychaea mexicana]